MASPAPSGTTITAQEPTVDGRAEHRVYADDARRSFLRMVSHELRTPLNSIIGFSEIINQEMCGPVGAPQYKEYAGLIGQSGHRLLKLVNQILDIVRLEGEAADLVLGPEALEPLVQEAFQQLDEAAAAKGVRFEREASLPEVTADPRALRTILINLLQNAVAFAPIGSVVMVRAVARGAEVGIEVQDHGDGVHPDDLDRIVRPFEQGEPSLTRHSQGAGLGLPIARLLAEAMGGRLELRSSVGAGFIAAVTLPAA